MYNGLIVVAFALAPVEEGDGGFICVPGSHRANVPCKYASNPPISTHRIHSIPNRPLMDPKFTSNRSAACNFIGLF